MTPCLLLLVKTAEVFDGCEMSIVEQFEAAVKVIQNLPKNGKNGIINYWCHWPLQQTSLGDSQVIKVHFVLLSVYQIMSNVRR